ncbi:flagellar hook capping FlgD N-terminal domain-containing protein [Pseudoroseicyclus tamaricis]|uniref:Basal-body rod modification protein FlgD n=1 Tax=Pseudoroseicyclus tamaricis TaxID=2705421 RepID=A0A6B2K6L2_9RHOB|nr:flagellar hook capping FlgD N-terminal domain-containing protein [Pseudoroseicyclus tamaricis]NDV02546.1 flagellar basal body rod modification protein [Pseudoroseicyclus tamaricis]
MDISPGTTAPPSTPAGMPVAAGQSDGQAVIASDFKTFLNMLTTQLQNQDPLDPVDADDFAMQLATFSGVEQQVLTNDLLTAMSGQLALTSMADMAGWVGEEVRVAAPAWFDGAPITVAPNPALAADRVELVVTDAEGTEVQRMEIPVSAEPVEWAGVDETGQPFPPGQYSFATVSYSEGEVLLSEMAEAYIEVTEVRAEGGDILLLFEGGAAAPASSVTGLRAAT